jgi:hypothetical protein
VKTSGVIRAVALAAGCGLAVAALSAPAWLVQPLAPMAVPRAAHQATPLPAQRAVLVSGGCSGPGCSPVERSAEWFDSDAQRFVPVAPMQEARVAHAAVALADGSVLVAGGWTGQATTAGVERFDPVTRRFEVLPPMGSGARMDAAAVALADGGALVVGGAAATAQPLASVERFDAAGRALPARPMAQPRVHLAAARLQDGRVLVAGGLVARGRVTAGAELFDPATGSWVATGALLQPRCKHAAVALPDGRVLVLAGSADCEDRERLASTEIYDPASGRFTPGPPLLAPRYKIPSSAALLPGGEVVIAGDADDVEIWVPGTPAFVRLPGGGGGPWRVAFSTATPLHTGELLVLGGYDAAIRATAAARLVGRTTQPAR